jgi:hypothetical protein
MGKMKKTSRKMPLTHPRGIPPVDRVGARRAVYSPRVAAIIASIAACKPPA